METAIQSSFVNKLGWSVSQYPGEDDGPEPPSRDITSYVIEHLLPHTLNISGRPRNQPLHDLAKQLKPEEFAAVLVLCADRIGDTGGVKRAGDLIVKPSHPSLEPLRTLQRRRGGGLGRAEIQKEELRQLYEDIQQAYLKLMSDGRPKHQIASILAARFGRSPTQIRRILKKTDTS
jgi:hypothetical protein